jgi:Spy/CpxP family protein refolding chaperone
MTTAVLASMLFTVTPTRMWGQNSHTQHTTPQPKSDQALADQLQQLRDQVSQLQETIRQQGMQSASGASASPRRPASTPSSMSGMSSKGGSMRGGMMMGEMGPMPMGKMDGKARMGPMPKGDGMKNMGMMMDDMGEMDGKKDAGCCMSGMDAMGNMSGSPSMAAQSALPGFPGASHLYHVGSTGFFLDHSDHVTLTTDQRLRLSRIKEKALLDKATAQRNIDEAEQQLFSLTAIDQPDQTKIETQIRSIENLRAQQRLAYIRAVGEAAQVLTDAQRQSLLGKTVGK